MALQVASGKAVLSADRSELRFELTGLVEGPGGSGKTHTITLVGRRM